MRKVVLGIDPGFGRMGFGVVAGDGNNLVCLTYGVIETDSKALFSVRLSEIHASLLATIDQYQPDFVAIEQLFFCNNAKTALRVGEARGVALLTAIIKKLPIYEFTPLQAKQAVCGYGGADKRQIQRMVKNYLKLAEIPQPDDAADALALAICAANSYKMIDLKK